MPSATAVIRQTCGVRLVRMSGHISPVSVRTTTRCAVGLRSTAFRALSFCPMIGFRPKCRSREVRITATSSTNSLWKIGRKWKQPEPCSFRLAAVVQEQNSPMALYNTGQRMPDHHAMRTTSSPVVIQPSGSKPTKLKGAALSESALSNSRHPVTNKQTNK